MVQEAHPKKAFIWNMLGSTCYSLSSFLFLIFVTRLSGVELAGFFSLSYATAQLLLAVGRFGMRTYQATDINEEYSFAEYVLSRVVTCFLMIGIGLVYSLISFNGEYILISVYIIAIKMNDAVEDIFHGKLQQRHHVELMGKLLFSRNLYTTLVFAVLLWKSRNLGFTCGVTATSSLILNIVMNSCFTRKVLHEKLQLVQAKSRQIFALLKKCIPLFVGTFLSLLLYNIPKYAMAGILSDDYQTYYSILFMPSFVITLMCEFVFKPTITGLAEIWFSGNKAKFIKKVFAILLIIAGGGICIMLGGHLLGRTLLEIIYGVNLEAYKLSFVILLLGGSVSAEVYMIYNILIAIRHGECMIWVYSIVSIITFIPARFMVNRWGIMGASGNYLLSSMLLFLFFASILYFVVRKEEV